MTAGKNYFRLVEADLSLIDLFCFGKEKRLSTYLNTITQIRINYFKCTTVVVAPN